jgi:Cu(I)/Ag(I) efflux system membrane fusion protein
MKGVLALLLLAGAFTAGYFFRGAGAAKPERKVLYWVDPMHPSYRSDRPGMAPDCGMPLEPVYANGAAPAERRVLYYYDPEQPGYRSENPGFNPETGNELAAHHEGDPPPGALSVPRRKQQLIGVTYGTVEITPVARTIRAVGRVAADETRIHHVHAKIEGWIEDVAVGFVGQQVRKGELLFRLYSPDLLAAQQEYLLALRARDELARARREDTRRHAAALVEAARRKLALWDLTPEQIAELERTRQARRTLDFYSPAQGHVTQRNVFPHHQVKPETELYTIVDYSRVWVLADVYEADIPAVGVGMAATVHLPYAPGGSFPSRVSYVQPELDGATRTLKIRLELANPRLTLKPEMYVEVDLRVTGAPRLTAPAEAVLDAGHTHTVFVDRGEGYFEPRTVEVGERVGGRIVILHGLRPGERVVTSGNFLLDAESKLKSAAGAMSPAEASASGAGSPPHRHDHD